MSTIDLSSTQWRKSRHSNDSGACVEVADAWRKSSHSGSEGNCVEVGQAPGRVVAVRDTQDRGGSVLTVSPAAWRAFTDAIRQGRAVQS